MCSMAGGSQFVSKIVGDNLSAPKLVPIQVVKRDACRHTRCVTMQEAVPVTRPLQNHLPEVTHFTTDAGEWMPQ